MRSILKIFILLLPGLFSINMMVAQGTRCDEIEPFCAGDERLTFPNVNSMNSSQVNGEIGPDYGCLDEQPYPAWFFLQIKDGGDLEFRISQYQNEDGSGAALDVDFVVWGPFERGEQYCSGLSLDASKIVDCSYLPDAVEVMSIPNAKENMIYVVVITNFESTPGFINLEQTNSNVGKGSTDCSILDFGLGDVIQVCDEKEYVLDAGIEGDLKYEWYQFNEQTSRYEIIPGENERSLTVTSPGDYRLDVTDIIENKLESDEVRVNFFNSPEIGAVDAISVCKENNEIVDLTEVSAQLLGSNADDAERYELSFFESLEAVENGVNIEDPQVYPFQENKVIYAQVKDSLSDCVSEIEEFSLEIIAFPEYQLPDEIFLCVDAGNQLLNSASFGTNLGPGYSYKWYDGDRFVSSSPLVIFTGSPPASNLRVEISADESGCVREFSAMVKSVSRPETIRIDISGSDFGDGYKVTASPEEFIGEEYAEFEYRIDDSGWQAANTFSNVSAGNHVITARELNGCGETTSEKFFLVGYPRFFSPNGDGYNDTWNLITDNNIRILRLMVFDRYGKLVKELRPVAGGGWDGTINGKSLPADDYWFKVVFKDEKSGEYNEYMANFTLIR